MIDIHSHILPSIDDGAKDEQQSLAMLRAATEEGIHTIVASPHHQNGRYVNEAASVAAGVSKLMALAEKEGIGIKIIPSQEVRLYGDLLEDYAAGKLLPMGRYILIEFPTPPCAPLCRAAALRHAASGASFGASGKGLARHRGQPVLSKLPNGGPPEKNPRNLLKTHQLPHCLIGYYQVTDY
ncbi:MAG: hypothetical protein FWF59_11305 [Turicibacter sp.]|nr:hypothetical protein [Turicibacter sp.]